MEDARRAEGRSVRWKRNGDGWFAPKGQTRYFLLQPSLPLIQATSVRGALVLDTPARPVHSLLLACLARLLLIPRLPAVHYLRQNFANLLDVSLTPHVNVSVAEVDNGCRCRHFLYRKIPSQCGVMQSQPLGGLAC